MKIFLLRLCVLCGFLTMLWVTVGIAQDSSCGDALEPRLIIGGQGEVTPGSANNVRAQASTSAEVVFRMEAGSRFTVLEGPVCGEGYNWWRVERGSQSGWTVEGNPDGYFLMPIAEDTAVATATQPATTSADCDLPPRLVVGQNARVTIDTPSRVRDVAGLNGTQVGQINPIDTVLVVDGPVCLDGINWWRVSVGSTTGWTAEGLDGEYFLESIAPTPTPVPLYDSLPTAYDLDWNADGTLIAVATADGVFIFNSADWSAPPQQLLEGSRVVSLAFNPQAANQLAISTSYYDATNDLDRSVLYHIDVETGDTLSTISGQFFGMYRDLSFSDDGLTLAANSTGYFVAFDVATGELDYEVQPQNYGNFDLQFIGFTITAFSPDGGWIAGAYPGGTDSGGVVSFVFVGEYGASQSDLIGIETVSIPEVITVIAFSPESDRFVLGGENGNLRMWTLPDFDYHSFIRGERSTTSNWVTGIAFSPTEPVLATAEGDPLGVVRIFDATTLQQQQATVLPDSVGAAAGLVYSPDGSHIAVLIDNTVLILDSTTLEPIERLVLRWNQ